MKTRLEDMLKQPVSWLADKGPDDDIVLSTRIRLARNIRGVSFPISGNTEMLSQVREMVLSAFDNSDAIVKPMQFEISGLNDLEKQFLLERRLISRDFMKAGEESLLIAEKDESTAVMINEEDHLRFHVLAPGLQLRNVWEKINVLDNIIASKLPYAFDEKFGYLTTSPSNLGTGLRASVMVHIPGIVLSNQITAMTHGLNKLGLAVHGFYGEGSENLGNLYQISNQSTLGEREEQILDRLSAITEQIIRQEKETRHDLLNKKQDFLLNHIGRAYGILRFGYLISAEESLNNLSALRLGVDMGMFSSLNIHTVNELFLLVQPAHLSLHEKKQLAPEEQNALRAALLRKKLKGTKDKE